MDLLDNKLDYASSFGATELVNGAKGDAVEQVRGADRRRRGLRLRGDRQPPHGGAGDQDDPPGRHHGDRRNGAAEPDGWLRPAAVRAEGGPAAGSWYGSARPRLDFHRFIEMTLSGKLKVKEMITHVRARPDQRGVRQPRPGRGGPERHHLPSLMRVRPRTAPWWVGRGRTMLLISVVQTRTVVSSLRRGRHRHARYLARCHSVRSRRLQRASCSRPRRDPTENPPSLGPPGFFRPSISPDPDDYLWSWSDLLALRAIDWLRRKKVDRRFHKSRRSASVRR